MDLILWRHADAEEGEPDLERRLTPKGQKQAARVAEWLLQRLPAKFLVIASPAVRARQTAEALGVPVRTAKPLAPGASPRAILDAAGWPEHKGVVVVVGHQPDLGRAIATLMSAQEAEWRVKKGGLWWFSDKEQVIVRAVVSPDLL